MEQQKRKALEEAGFRIGDAADFLGLTDEELHIVACVARYHRKAPPDTSHECYAELAEKARGRVRALAAILRLADALDHDHRQRVVDVRAKKRDSELVLKARTHGRSRGPVPLYD